MKQNEIIELASTRTERKGRALNLVNELLCVIQDFVREKEWDWRFNTATFDTISGTTTYKLTAAPISLTDIADVVNLSRTQDGRKLDRVVDKNAQARILDKIDTPNDPRKWFKLPGDHDTVVINEPDANSIKLRVIYDAIPGSLPNDESIPLVPDHLHGLLADKLELRILKHLLGPESTKYQAAAAEYADKLAKA